MACNFDFTFFTVPGASIGQYAYDYNNNCVSVGTGLAGFPSFGYFRTNDGTITDVVIDSALVNNCQAINDNGIIVGFYSPTGDDYFAFLRNPDGSIVDNIVGDPSSIVSVLTDVNNANVAVGQWYDNVENATHSFLREADGTVISIDDPSAGTGTGQGTFVVRINNNGDCAGSYNDSNGNPWFFIRSSSGVFTTVMPPAGYIAGTTNFGPVDAEEQSNFGFNNNGYLCGSFLKQSNTVFYGFIRDVLGNVTLFSAPDAGTDGGFGQGTFPIHINDKGEVVGYYLDSDTNQHAFLRNVDGTFCEFDLPDTPSGSNFVCINNKSKILGNGGTLSSRNTTSCITSGPCTSDCFLTIFPLLGPYYDLQGNVIANGKISLRLVFDCNCPCADYQVTGNNHVFINLDDTGMVIGSPQVRPNDQLAPSGSYYIMEVYSSVGELILGPKILIV